LGRDDRPPVKVPAIFTDEHPTKEQFSTALRQLTARSVRMFFIYTVVSDNHYNYKNQFHDTFGYRDQIDVEYFTRADHVFSTQADRCELLSGVVGWMQDRFARDASPRTSRAAAPMKRA